VPEVASVSTPCRPAWPASRSARSDGGCRGPASRWSEPASWLETPRRTPWSFRVQGQLLQAVLTRAPAAAQRHDPTNPAPARPLGEGEAGVDGVRQGRARGARSTGTVRLRAPWSPLRTRSLTEPSVRSYPRQQKTSATWLLAGQLGDRYSRPGRLNRSSSWRRRDRSGSPSHRCCRAQRISTCSSPASQVPAVACTPACPGETPVGTVEVTVNVKSGLAWSIVASFHVLPLAPG
jgi:hypothetical protein